MSIQTGDDKIPFIDLGDGFIIRLEYEDLSDEKYIEKAKNELRESPEVVQAAISELRILIKGKFIHKKLKQLEIVFIKFIWVSWKSPDKNCLDIQPMLWIEISSQLEFEMYTVCARYKCI